MANEFLSRLKQRVQLDRERAWALGVCAGVANYCNLDPAIVRVGVVVTGLFLPKITIAAYLIAWVVLDDR